MAGGATSRPTAINRLELTRNTVTPSVGCVAPGSVGGVVDGTSSPNGTSFFGKRAWASVVGHTAGGGKQKPQCRQADGEDRTPHGLGHRQLDHEAGATARPVLDPHLPAVQADVLGDERQTEADAVAVRPSSGRRAPGEALEHVLTLRRRHTGAGVVDLEAHAAVATSGSHPYDAAAVGLAVGDEVGDHALDATLVGPHDQPRRGRVDVDGHGPIERGPHGVAHQLPEAHLLEIEVGGTHVEAGDLEQVLHEPLESVEVGGEKVEGAACPLGHLLAPGLHHLERCGQGGERASATRG